jgi:hypothetical protein
MASDIMSPSEKRRLHREIKTLQELKQTANGILDPDIITDVISIIEWCLHPNSKETTPAITAVLLQVRQNISTIERTLGT